MYIDAWVIWTSIIAAGVLVIFAIYGTLEISARQSRTERPDVWIWKKEESRREEI